MLFEQSKLTRDEWNSTELSLDENEKFILNLLIEGFDNVNLKKNKQTSLYCFIKIDETENMSHHLYETYFSKHVNKLTKKYKLDFSVESKKIKSIKSSEKIKIDNLTKEIENSSEKIFEYNLLYYIKKLCRYNEKKDTDNFHLYYFTLKKALILNIKNINSAILKFCNYILDYYLDKFDINLLFKNANKVLLENDLFNDLQDYSLYDHQKKIFALSKIQKPKLMFYVAPTGTGKTLTPIGLTNKYKVIFVCAARHVGLALARSAISVGKKIAFAFGCNSVDDIRLHYNSASEFVKREDGSTIKYRDGKKKVDHTIGNKVELMICDLKSYTTAMYYMNSFNLTENLIMYWDEPTIGLDKEITSDSQEEDKLIHYYIKKNWSENVVSNIILSSATLPNQDDLTDLINDYRSKFMGDIINITSDDCNRSISLLTNENYLAMPHLLYSDYTIMKKCIDHCDNYKTILRYFDLQSILNFIVYCTVENLLPNERFLIENYYDSMLDINLVNIKNHYIEILKEFSAENYQIVYDYFNQNKKKVYDSTINVSTSDAYTLKNGPTIFLSNSIEKIGKFIINSSKIPEKLLEEIFDNITKNDTLLKQIIKFENEIDNATSDDGGQNVDGFGKIKGASKEFKETKEIRELIKKIEQLTNNIKTVNLPDVYIPNKFEHLKKWTSKNEITDEFSCNINEEIVKEIMFCKVDKIYKVLLIMGIGIFINHKCPKYLEIMKELSQQQKLFIVIASSDYIYGTNYQFSNGYISKDLTNMTQEKTVQAMGRIGRNAIGKSFSIRFRDNECINKIFQDEENKIEANNMNMLFTSS